LNLTLGIISKRSHGGIGKKALWPITLKSIHFPEIHTVAEFKEDIARSESANTQAQLGREN
jgi:hypothetical protein